ncbi:MAG: hypothetical protein KDA80_02015 [Planctomycetaceae bacterium]|nr:hypothetical protein [Planctomycetaceae bacterium]
MRTIALLSTLFLLPTICAGEEIDLGSRLELFVDGSLIEKVTGDVQHKVHQPEPGDVVLTTDKPWEGNTCAYYTIFQDGNLFRMYYRGSHADEKTRKGLHPEVTCYAESRDGIHWTRPELGIVEYEGSKANNIILDGLGSHCFVAFKDDNPECPPEAKYKGISRGRPHGKKGLYVFQSPDAVHWSLIKDEPVITEGAFDSQNLAFWDPVTKQYVDYHRYFANGVRSILTCTSDDYVNWTKPVPLTYPGQPHQHLYTNAVRPYFRAPHIRVGFPTRFLPKTEQVEPVFMSSRDGVTFTRYADAVIPQSAPADRDGNRSNYMANGLVQLPGDEKTLTVYATEAYYAGPDSRLRRFIYRVDGFVSMHAGEEGGEFVTPPLKTAGGQLILNYETREGGSVQVEVQRADGTPVPDYTLSKSNKLTGDKINGAVNWSGKESVAIPSGEPIRLRFVMKNADLYSLRFRPDDGD